MPNVGRPSRDCQSCRQRRIKCDLLRPHCGQCLRKGRLCPGYRDELLAMHFRLDITVSTTSQRHRNRPERPLPDPYVYGDANIVDHLIRQVLPAIRMAPHWIRECCLAFVSASPSPLVLHSIHYATASHYRKCRQQQSPSIEELHHRGHVLHRMREAFNLSDMRPIFDEVLLAAFVLAVHDAHSGFQTRDPSPFKPLFPSLQALDLHGGQSYHPQHWTAVEHLLARRGSFTHIKIFALPWWLSYVYLKRAVATCTPPLLPLLTSEGELLDDISPAAMLGKIPLQISGFHCLTDVSIPPARIRPLCQLTELADAMAQITTPRSAGMMDRLGDARNVVQHGLLSMPKGQHQTEASSLRDSPPTLPPGHACHVYDACRLAALLFSTHVTFPYPQTCGIRAMLVPQLLSALMQLENDCFYSSPNIMRALLWCATVGGVTAATTRSWFITYLARLSTLLDIQSYDEVNSALRPFAWIDAACDDAGQQLWRDVSAHVLVDEFTG
ncbi:hypothetical protein ASPZODRAFT_25599 [Penicilliopsis zonata CBS 506.65]|uniref:Zn(2)-C6 fungal-type domain-containing protein n=1 Tax=Penicilliopsis zonata CBS 506.65 TaxID=1073090 RepID=A0A1L9SH71_9EURO|nr:hypothetical protein ASPZODRAFT_25599 [Penicilliopsis zonata CBS 506.65]OJJ46501.1 hypothetical protein ASPZODRAFT_25599 [Penicilliopsis zonata CBS 506.65]